MNKKMKVVNNMLRSILILIAIITITAACSSSAPPRPIKPIVHTINFKCSLIYSSMWSSEGFENMKFPQFYLLDYKDYAKTFEEFSEKYPKITLDTSGVAKSDIGLYGDFGNNKFGQLTFSTSDFNTFKYGRYRTIVNSKRFDGSNDDVIAKIRVAFGKKGTNLYLVPYLYGRINYPWDEGSLNLALYINTITFHQ